MACSRRAFLHHLSRAGAMAGVSTFAARAAAAAKQPPNIVYIMSDELGYYELSCMGNPHFHTPNIDRLAAEGVRFTQGLAGSSVCAPTRCCLMTGKHAGHTSVRTNGGGTPLREGEATVASVLKQAGYATGGFGKWGCGGRGSTGVPENHGFDIFLGYYDQVHAHSYYPPYIICNSEEQPLTGNHGGSNGKTYSHYVIMDAAKAFIEAHRQGPFFCYLPVTPPHGNFDIPESDPARALYQDKDWPEQAKRYAAMVSMVDRQVGELRALLKGLGIDRNTIIFFCGDNGGQDYFRDPKHPRGFHGPNVDPKTGKSFRGHKGNLYEGGLRIPMIVNWPGHIRPGRVSDFLWYFPDVLPTLAELAGVPAPKDVDGISIVPELIGEPAAGHAQQDRKFLYWELGSQTAVRMEQWKLIRPGAKAAWELYDLSRDLEEQHNVAKDSPAILARMIAFARKAHEPAREGIFHDRTLHEKDRRAKFGDQGQPGKTSTAAHHLPTKGLVPRKDYRVVRASSESRFNGKVAINAFDGDPNTLWHTQWQGKLASHPHELVIDLGAERTVSGFRYLARQDSGWNGALKEAEFYVGDDPEKLTHLAVKATFSKTRNPQEVSCPPVRGRFVLLRSRSEVNDGPWASIAELGVIGK